jgi:Flp pilus assembly protein TadG
MLNTSKYRTKRHATRGGAVSLPARENQRGIAVILTALMLVGLIPVTGLAIDASVLYAVKAKLSTACDAAALSAARSLSRGLTLGEQESSAVTRARAFFAANLPAGYLLTSNPTVDVRVAESGYRTRTVTVDGSVNAPVFFMSFLGFTTARVRATGTASRRDVNLILVLDRSNSMNISGSCNLLKSGAAYFTSQFANGRDRLSLITFGTQYYPAYGPSQNFLSDSPSMVDMIDSMTCGMNTNSSTAYSEAYRQLVTIGESGALNVIVFFTDGRANGLTGDFPVRTAMDTRYGYPNGPYGCQRFDTPCAMPPSNCTWTNSTLSTSTFRSYQQSWSRDHLGMTYGMSNPNPYWANSPDRTSPKTGVIAQQNNPAFDVIGWTTGLWTKLATSVSDDTADVAGNSAGCDWPSNSGTMRRDLAYIPNTDTYGNRVDCCYESPETYSGGPWAGHIRIDKPSTMGKASNNAVDSAATTARNNAALNVVTYVIGLGDTNDPQNGPDETLMRRMSNDPSSPIYDQTKPLGFYAFAPDNTQLQQAFSRVASEILRISQ